MGSIIHATIFHRWRAGRQNNKTPNVLQPNRINGQLNGKKSELTLSQNQIVSEVNGCI
ncbi:hypothetical protein PROVRETT_05452 [Providencia rettgeri DSM 1131]|nr:hypothetical protein PROVRETT_05452 [Providencia rettgeri DSM 1131]